MNMSACATLNAEEELLLGDGQPHDEEASAQIERVLEGVRAACAATEWPAFRSALRFHGPQMVQAWQRLWDFVPPDAVADDDDSRLSLSERLKQVGVSEKRIDYIQHASRMVFRAHAIAHMLDEHSDSLPSLASERKAQGELAEWMYRFARLILWQVAYGKLDVEAPCLQFATQLAVEEARDAYAYYATALEEAEHAA